MTYPKNILIREDGPREGFQSLQTTVPVAEKLRLIELLTEAGAKSIEVTSFVRPDRVPQHADAEEVAAGLPTKKEVRFRALYLNRKGLERASACENLSPEGYLMTAASEAFLKRNNNLTIDEAKRGAAGWLDVFKKHGIELDRLMVSCAFGEAEEGKISPQKTLDIVSDYIENLSCSLPEVTFADTTGYANPASIEQLVSGFRKTWPSIEIGLHLHDTRGTGLANALAGLQAGVSRFDSSVAGLGGCPFVKNAAGNISSEDLAFLCSELDIETGVNLELYIKAAKYAEEITGLKLPGKLKDGGLPKVG